MAKFKEGDRVRVTWVESNDDYDVGATGTVKENDSSDPWVHFDNPTRYLRPCYEFGIPKGYAAVVSENQIELIEPDGRTAADDYRDYGIAFEVDGKRVDPSRVRAYRTSWPNRHD